MKRFIPILITLAVLALIAIGAAALTATDHGSGVRYDGAVMVCI